MKFHRLFSVVVVLVGSTVITSCAQKPDSNLQSSVVVPTITMSTTDNTNTEETSLNSIQNQHSQELFDKALKQAERAVQASKSAVSNDDWSFVVRAWKQAIEALEGIPKDDPNYTKAQSKLKEYKAALSVATAKTKRSTTAIASPHSLPVSPSPIPSPVVPRQGASIKERPQVSATSNVLPAPQPRVVSAPPSQARPIPTPQPVFRAISGQITVIDPYYGTPGEPCNQYRKGYQDVMQGTTVTIRNGNDKIIATVDTPPGINVDTGVQTNSPERFVTCVVSVPQFQVPDSDFFTFDLGRRGKITRSRQQLQQSGWQFQFTLGGT